MTHIQGFLDFIREKGVVGLAVGFIIGGAVSGLVRSLVDDIINPLVGLMLGKAETLTELTLSIGDSSIRLGNFINVFVNFVVIACVVYFGIKILKLDHLDKQKK